MSKKKIFLITLSVILVIAIIAGIATFVVLKKIESDRNYTIEKIDKYNYFVLKTNNSYGVIDNNGNTIITIKKQVCLIDHNHIVSFLKTVFP